MQFFFQLDAIVNHAVSQFAYRWLPVFQSLSVVGADRRFNPHGLALTDWYAYIEARRTERHLAAWVAALERLPLSAIGLATVIYDNLAKIAQGGGNLIDFFHPHYPYLLKHIPDPPACLTCIGEVALLDKPKLGLVGSRKASDFAYRESRALGRALAQRGIVVVSGGAIGCDAAAHRGAWESLQTPVPTIVVFAGGLHKPYPQCNHDLFCRLQSGGALFLSERLWDYPARPMDFPVRNRIIAGLSPYLALMQAGEKSGALKTASYALEQGREVYALVHEEDDVRALGSHRLIDEGALPFQSVQDFLSLAMMQ